MAGKQGRSGRRRKAGRLVRLSYRFRPGKDPPELGELLERIRALPFERGQEVLRAALLGGLSRAQEAATVEAAETAAMLEDLFGGWATD